MENFDRFEPTTLDSLQRDTSTFVRPSPGVGGDVPARRDLPLRFDRPVTPPAVRSPPPGGAPGVWQHVRALISVHRPVCTFTYLMASSQFIQWLWFTMVWNGWSWILLMLLFEQLPVSLMYTLVQEQLGISYMTLHFFFQLYLVLFKCRHYELIQYIPIFTVSNLIFESLVSSSVHLSSCSRTIIHKWMCVQTHPFLLWGHFQQLLSMDLLMHLPN